MMTTEMNRAATPSARWAYGAGTGLLFVFAFFAVSGTAIALIALALMLIAALVDGGRFGRALAGSPAAWIALALAFYVIGRALIAAWLQPEHAGAHYEAIWHWLALLLFVLPAWFLKGDSRRVRLVLAVAMFGLLAGMARTSDWQQVVDAVTDSGPRFDFGMTFLDAALYLGVALLGWVAFIEKLIGSGRWRWLRALGWLLVAAVLAEMLYLTQSRAVLLSLLVLLPALALFKLWRARTRMMRRRGLAACAVLVIALVILGVLNWQSIAHRAHRTAQSMAVISTFSLEQIPYSPLGARVHIYVFGGQVWLERPVFGWGPGMKATEMLPSAPIYPSTNAPFAHLHDGYLEVLVRFGVVGFVLALALAFVLARGLYRGWRRGEIPEDIALFLLVATLLAALTNLSDFRAVHAYYRYFTIFLLGLIYTWSLTQSRGAGRQQPAEIPNPVPGLRRQLQRRQPVFASSVSAQALFVVSDVVAIIGSGYIAYVLRFGTWAMPAHYRSVLAIAVLAAIVIFPNLRLYDAWYEKPVLQRLWSLLVGWGLVALALIVLAFVLKESENYSRLWFGIWGLVTSVALVVLRNIATRVLARMRSTGQGRRRVVVVGQDAIAERAVRRTHVSDHSMFKVCRVVPLDYDQPIAWLADAGTQRLSRRVSLARFIERAAVDEVWFCFSLRQEQAITDFQAELRHVTAVQRFIPDIDAYRILRQNITEVHGLPALDLNNSPMRGMNRGLKVLEDRALSAIILLCISPLLLVIAIGVKLSTPGPVIFSQRRHGWNGQPIYVHKFRSMAVSQSDGIVTQATRDDRRVTRIGRILRSTSLDELPQFWNVLKGEMSIVGPRPHAMEHNTRYQEEIHAYMQRHSVKPGITGWAQIHGLRGETRTLDEMRERIEYDLAYIEHWSLWLDFKIMVLTPFKGLVNEHAY